MTNDHPSNPAPAPGATPPPPPAPLFVPRNTGLATVGRAAKPDIAKIVSLAFTSGVHPVAYNGVDCTLRNAASFQYGGVRSFYFVTRGAPVGKVKKFIGWVTSSNKANKVVGTDWVPLH